MANTQLTPDMITSEALRVLHQKCNFVRSINRQYDDQYAREGAKIGSELRIRMPNQFSVRTGAVMGSTGVTETSQTLTLATQKGVDMDFGMAELTLSLDKFSERYIQPAMSVLAANIESDVITSVYKNVYNEVANIGSAASSAKILAGRKVLIDNLTPDEGLRANLNTQDNIDLVEALKTLFHASERIRGQYEDGSMGHAFGFDFYENTHWPRHTTGTNTNEIVVNGANQTGSTITVTNGSSKTLVVGDVITFAGCNRVHPETKVDTGVHQQFVVTTALTSSGTQLAISPSIVTSGPTQNVSASPTTAQAVTKVGSTSAVAHGISMLYHKDAFTFVSADLMLPNGAHMASRKQFDGFSMRLWSDGDIVNDRMLTRLDVLYGFKTIRPEWACRLANN